MSSPLMLEIAAEQIQRLWAFLLTSWLPIVLSVGAVAFRLWPADRPAGPPVPSIALGSAEILSSVMWCFLYAEHLSPVRVPVFDYGAPALAVLSLLALPVLGLLAARGWRDLVGSRGAPQLLLVTLPLLLLSLFPGIYAVWFYAAMAYSER